MRALSLISLTCIMHPYVMMIGKQDAKQIEYEVCVDPITSGTCQVVPTDQG